MIHGEAEFVEEDAEDSALLGFSYLIHGCGAFEKGFVNESAHILVLKAVWSEVFACFISKEFLQGA